jgi:SAM-dependent methyltransferase
MSKGLVSLSSAEQGYTGTLAAAGTLAKQILKKVATNEQQLYLQRVAHQLEPYAGNGTPYVSVEPYFNAISQHLDQWWNGNLPTHIFARLDWNRLMNEVPMGRFSELANDFCRENDLYRGKVLEIGAGVGNFSKYVPSQCEYIRTDKNSKFLNGRWLIERELDIDKSYGVKNTFELIVGVNVMHCARDKSIAVLNAYSALKPNGVLLLGEGMNPAEVWALDILFGFIDGWWNNGGFIDRHAWLEIFHKLNPHEIGYSVCRESKYDLGGLIWLRK